MFRFIHVIIDVPPAVADRSAAFWSEALGWPLGDPWADHPEFRSLVPPDGAAYVHLQVSDHGPRVHLDAEVADVAASAARLIGLGADGLVVHSDWQSLHSPGGLSLCLVPATHRAIPAPLVAPGGHRLRLLQVCIDMPHVEVADEVGFWRSATGWRWVASSDDAFAGKLHRHGVSPVQLLLQVLGEADGGQRTRAHIDLGSDDVEAAVDRLVGLGAVRGPTGAGWVVMTDPVGLAFCVTGNAPD